MAKNAFMADFKVGNTELVSIAAIAPARSSMHRVSVRKPARESRMPCRARSFARASTVSAPVLSIVLTVLPSMTSHFNSAQNPLLEVRGVVEHDPGAKAVKEKSRCRTCAGMMSKGVEPLQPWHADQDGVGWTSGAFQEK